MDWMVVGSVPNWSAASTRRTTHSASGIPSWTAANFHRARCSGVIGTRMVEGFKSQRRASSADPLSRSAMS